MTEPRQPRRSETSREATYRAGTKTDNKMTYVRTPEMVTAGQCEAADVITYVENGQTLVRALAGGISLFNAVSPSRSWWYRLPPQKLPVGLVFTWKAKTEGIPAPGTHYQIEPLRNMPLDHYRRLLKDVQVQPEPIAGSSVGD
jgi:hypothetical protein